jgi:hypothetical protein
LRICAFSPRDKAGNSFSKSLKLAMAFLYSLSLMLDSLATTVFPFRAQPGTPALPVRSVFHRRRLAI